MTAELVRESSRQLAFPPHLLGYARDLTMAWLLSYDSPNTRDAYRREIERWFRFCAEHDLDPLEARRPHGDVYKRWLELQAGQPVPLKTMARRLAAVSSWYKYLAEEDAVEFNPFENVRRPKINRKHSETTALTRDEARAMVEAADKDHGPARLRTAALIRLLLRTGIRISEAVDATIGDLGFARGYRTLRIVAKGAEPKIRRLPVETTFALDTYLSDRARRAGVELADLRGPLFASESGKPMTRGQAYELVVRIARQAGIEGKVTPHTCRHTYASIAEEAGVPMRKIQLNLGHKDASTTEIYVESRERLEDDASQIVESAME
ncbi:tyrosine-type recombinase/integrase [Nonomuraea mangrovi]|uniref:Tyrosine-type recombinase/integrase n=1 Tax=Nonomuraea mangrovi TaxID=2316207 RepID=A0ABW4SS42_9ACTN